MISMCLRPDSLLVGVDYGLGLASHRHFFLMPIDLLWNGPRCRCDIGQNNTLLQMQAGKRIADRTVLLSWSNNGLNEHSDRIAPNYQLTKRTESRVERDDLLVFLADRSMIQAHRHDDIVDISPTPDESKVVDLK
jgi:hypothetical protein